MATIRGEAALRQNFTALAQSPSRILDQACVEALSPMKQQTEANAKALRQPRSPKGGHLDQGVAVAKVDSRGQNYRVFWLAFRRRARKIAHLVEFGTAPHWQPNFRGGWMHPGARPKPFLRPAFEQHKGGAATIFGAKMWAGLVASIRGVAK